MSISWLENQIAIIKIEILYQIFNYNLGTSRPFRYLYPVHERCKYLLYVQLSLVDYRESGCNKALVLFASCIG